MAVRVPAALLALGLGGVAAPVYADLWPDLWLRPDQQGDRALAAGHADQAAKLYTNPLRRGFAELQAGQFAAAARDLEPYRDPLAQYDRGNALARQGQLQPALEAYDAALGRAVAGSALARAARHNRDLVAQALAQQPPQASQGSSGTQGSAGPPRPRPDGDARQAPGQNGQNFSGMNQSAAQDASSGQNGLGQTNAAPGNPTPAGPQPGAGRDAAAPGAARGAQGESDRSRSGAASEAGASRAAESEQSIARDQWLRQIPDDPAGLLRRKFMIEHLIHEQEVRP